MRKELQLRQARKEDTALILSFIRELARDEKLEHEVVADEALLEQWLFERKTAEVIFASWEGKEVGFALYFYNFSTFLGRGGIYLEDLYVKAAYRGEGSVRPCSAGWRPSRASRAAAVWNGGAWTETAPASTSIFHWAQSRCRRGPYTASAAAR